MLQPDQWEYLVPVGWFWYGWLGIILARSDFGTYIRQPVLTFLLGVLSLGGLYLLYTQTQLYLTQTQDILGALKFTRWPVLVYASLMSLFLISVVPRVSKNILVGLAKIGSLSFLIYLSHPMLIRLATYPFESGFSLTPWVVGLAITTGLVALSAKFMKS
jgi:hypothetical protein